MQEFLKNNIYKQGLLFLSNKKIISVYNILHLSDIQHFHHYNNFKYNEENLFYNMKLNSIFLTKLINTVEVAREKTLLNYCEILKEVITNHLTNNKNYDLFNSNFKKLVYSQLSLFSNNVFKKNNLTIIIKPYFLAYKYDTDDLFTVLYSLTIEEQYSEYYKMCLITNSNVDLSIFKFYVSSLLNNKLFNEKNIKTFYKKEIKSEIDKLEIPIITVDNLTKLLYQSVELPKLNTIAEHKNYLEDIKNQFIKTL